MKSTTLLTILTAGVLGLAGSASAVSLSLSANDGNAMDAFVRRGPGANTAYDNNPAGAYGYKTIEVDPWEGGGVNHGLFRFIDLIGTGAGQIAPGSTIHSATLSLLYVNDNKNRRVDVYQMTTDWDESSTWNSIGGGINGGNAQYDQTVRWGRNDPVTVSLNITDMLQSWADGDPNYGIGFINRHRYDGLQFVSSDYPGGTGGTPQLDVEYTAAPVVPEPLTLAGVAAALTGVGFYMKNRSKGRSE